MRSAWGDVPRRGEYAHRHTVPPRYLFLPWEAVRAVSNYLPLADVARVCVLAEYTLLSRYWPAHWAVPRDWRWVRTAILVNEASLPDLVSELRENGQAGTAAVLQKWLDENAAEARLEDFIASRSPSRATSGAGNGGNLWYQKGQYE